jgi:hypothetical protein
MSRMPVVNALVTDGQHCLFVFPYKYWFITSARVLLHGVETTGDGDPSSQCV